MTLDLTFIALSSRLKQFVDSPLFSRAALYRLSALYCILLAAMEPLIRLKMPSIRVSFLYAGAGIVLLFVDSAVLCFRRALPAQTLDRIHDLDALYRVRIEDGLVLAANAAAVQLLGISAGDHHAELLGRLRGGGGDLTRRLAAGAGLVQLELGERMLEIVVREVRDGVALVRATDITGSEDHDNLIIVREVIQHQLLPQLALVQTHQDLLGDVLAAVKRLYLETKPRLRGAATKARSLQRGWKASAEQFVLDLCAIMTRTCDTLAFEETGPDGVAVTVDRVPDEEQQRAASERLLAAGYSSVEGADICVRKLIDQLVMAADDIREALAVIAATRGLRSPHAQVSAAEGLPLTTTTV